MTLGVWATLVPHTSRANGSISTGPRSLPSGFKEAALRIDCTTGTLATPFTGFSPAFNSPTMAITLTTFFSWDGGATFPESATSTVNGQPTGSWGSHHGVDNMAPTFTRGIPFDSTLGGAPNFYKADITVAGGPIDFGLSLMES